MGQVAACATVNHCCASAEKGKDVAVEPAAVLRADLPPDVRLVAWLRRRSGPECDFGDVFEEIFGTRDPVGEKRFSSVLKERGASTQIDAQGAFLTIDAMGKGAIGAADIEAWQEKVEKKEVDGLRAWRDWLRKRYTTPSAAYHAMGKGEGDVLVDAEFTESLAKLGFVTENPHELFRFVDKDFSGEITFAEFKSAMRSVGVQRVKEKANEKANRRSGYTPAQQDDEPERVRPRRPSKEDAGRGGSKDIGDGIAAGGKRDGKDAAEQTLMAHNRMLAASRTASGKNADGAEDNESPAESELGN